MADGGRVDGGHGDGGRAAEEGWVRRYDARVVVIHWLFIIAFIPLLYTGLLLFRDWFASEFHVHGIHYLLPTFEGTLTVHIYTGVGVLVVGLVHVLLHIGQREKPILPKNVGIDLGSSIHNILYIFHMVRKQERGAGDKYRGNQRMTYVAFAYCLSLSGLTAVLARLHVLGDVGTLLHACAGVLIIFLSLYRILTLIRRHDGVAMRCILATGRMPVWYVRRNHFLWYRQLRGGYKAPPDPQYERMVPNEIEQGEVMKG